MSSDGLAKGLGRTKFSGVDGSVVRGDLHFWKSSRRSPDGDLAAHVATRAEEDAESFGSSIVFYHDYDAESEFREANLEDYEYTDRWGDLHKGKRFKSPDPLNTRNLPHARLKELSGCDIVDDPAANPDGLFSRDSVFEEVECLAEFLFGEPTDAPKLESLDIDPERAKSFLNRFLSTKGLSIVKTKLNDAPETETPEDEKPPENGAENSTESNDSETSEDSNSTESETSDSEAESESSETESETSDSETSDSELSSGQKEAARYAEAFGEKGPLWFSQGLSFEQAASKFRTDLQAENELLRKQLKAAESASSEPVDLGEGEGEKTRKGFANKIKNRTAASGK